MKSGGFELTKPPSRNNDLPGDLSGEIGEVGGGFSLPPPFRIDSLQERSTEPAGDRSVSGDERRRGTNRVAHAKSIDSQLIHHRKLSPGLRNRGSAQGFARIVPGIAEHGPPRLPLLRKNIFSTPEGSGVGNVFTSIFKKTNDIHFSYG